MVGRKEEIDIIHSLLKSEQAEFLAIIGRRRVGKTYLIREALGSQIDFELIGMKDGTLDLQLRNFKVQLDQVYPNNNKPIACWFDAFDVLADYMLSLPKTKKSVFFFDEFPWLDGPKSGFKTAFSHFWNRYASAENVLVIICGSSASYMIDKVMNDRGGLHNRVTKWINLQPFTLSETKEFLETKGIIINHLQIIQLYMTFGGIPHYLKQIEKGLSASQNIDKQCFQAHGFLKNEFHNLYQALFRKAERHEELVELFSKKASGLTRQALADQSSLSNGGALTKVLVELEQSGFIQSSHPFGKKTKDKIYRLTDYFTLFYFRFMADAINTDSGYFMTLQGTQSYKTWSGYAFENICLQHTKQIKKALGIAGVYSANYSFYHAKTADYDTAQIDLVIDRKDGVINLCEMKFYDGVYSFTAKDAEKINRQRSLFRAVTKTKKLIFNTFISTYGYTENQHSLGQVDNNVTMDVLFG